MSGTDGALARHWVLLRSLERAPRKVDTATLQRRLAEEGFHVSRRSIQRDLVALSALFPIECDDRSKPYGWAWAREAEPFDLPAMDPRTAMTFRLVGTWLAQLLPRVTWRELAPHLARADRVLGVLATENPLARWPEKVRIVPDAVDEQPPAFDPEVLDAAYGALLDERMLEIEYRSRGAPQPRRFPVSPLGLVFRGPLVYLVCVAEGEQGPVTLVLSRASGARALDRPRSVPTGFDLDAWLATGHPRFLLSPEPIHLVVRIRREAAQRVIEAPPGADPAIEEDEDHVVLRTTLPDTRPMRAWLLGFGSALEVLAPAVLRASIAAEVSGAAGHYEPPKPRRRRGR